MKISILSAIALSAFLFTSCGGEEKAVDNTLSEAVQQEVVENEEAAETNDDLANKGIGPISSVELTDIDDLLADQGKELYKTNCTACHKIGKRSIGPGLAGVTERRSPEWVMNMIMNPEEMVEKDPIAKALLAEYIAPMANQSISEEDARAILEFLRTKN